MKGVAFERFHTLNSSELRRCQYTVGEDHEACFHLVTAICGDGPSSCCFVPICFFNCCVEEAVIVEAEFLSYFLAVLHNLETRSKLHGWYVIHLFK